LDPLGVVDHGGGVDGAINMVDPLMRPNFLNLSSKKEHHCRKSLSSAVRVMGMWLWMLIGTMVEAGGGIRSGWGLLWLH
jgi:hypothetical protein